MPSTPRKIYAVMPVGIQNILVSLRGWAFNRNRYTGKYRWYFDNLMRSQWLSAEQFRDLQTAELRKLIKEAAQNVPYYRKTLGKFLNKLDSLTLDNLKDIPVVDKSFFRANVKEFTNPESLKHGYEIDQTSGTSGSPLVIKYDFSSLKYNLAFRERQYRWAGVTKSNVSVHFSGHLILGRHNRPPFWRYNALEKQWLFSIYHMHDDNLGCYADKLAQIQPVYIDGYPSSLYVLAKWLQSSGRAGEILPWVVITTAENLDEHQRNLIEKVFGCRSFDYYSSSEGAPYITQCAAGSYHINPESGIVEFLRPDGEYAEPGEEAEMVITSFFQRTVPLIRYRIGDTAVLAENQDCPCGRQMPVIKYIGGRQTECVYSTERGWVSSVAISCFMFAIPDRINGSQIEQIGSDSFILRYIPNGSPLNQQEIAAVLEKFYDRLGRSIDVKFEVVDEIPKGPAGKSRMFIGLSAEELKSLKND